MTDDERSAKNNTIRETLKETKLRHASMRPFVVELKLDTKCLNNTERSKLYSYFTECRWLANYLIGLDSDAFRTFKTTTRDITSLDKDRNVIQRHLELPAKLIQTVRSLIVNDMKALAAKRRKTGKAGGRLKFRSEYNSIDLNQYGNTHWICYMDEGNSSGRYRNTVHITGIKRPIRVFGMDQIPDGTEFSNAKLIRKASGIYLHLTCYIAKSNGNANMELKPAIGIDMGIKTTVTTSEGDMYDISVRESERLKGLHKQLSRRKKGSRGWWNTRQRMRREYERIANRRLDMARKLVHTLTADRELVVIQDESISGWHKGLFGKAVQNSALGTVKDRLKRKDNVVVISRWFPSTKMCPECGQEYDIALKDRTYQCPHCGYTEDRDIKAAKTILLAGQIEASTHMEHMGTPVERMSDFRLSYESWKQSAVKPEAATL